MKKEKEIMEYEEAESGFVTLYNYKEPLMPFETGHGFQGTLLFDGKSGKVQCHFCGGWYDYLPRHITLHGLNAETYKQAVGLRQSTALLNEKMRDSRIYTMAGQAKRLNNLKRIKRKRTAKERAEISATLKANPRQTQNEKGTCPFQLLHRLTLLAEKLGRTPKHSEIPYSATLRKVFGSVPEALRRARLEQRKPGSNVSRDYQKTYTDQELIDLLHEFKNTEGRYPYFSDLKRGLLPSWDVYSKHFGSWNKARNLAFPEYAK